MGKLDKCYVNGVTHQNVTVEIRYKQLRLFIKGMNNLHMATPEAIEWISKLDIQI